MPKRNRKRQRKRSYLATVVVVLLVAIAAASGSFLLHRSGGPTTTTTTVSNFEFVSKPENATYVTEYPTQANTTSPNGIAVAANGNIWFALWNLSDIAVLNPANGSMHEYHVPGIKPGAMNTWGMAVDNSRSLVWFPEFSSNSIWEFNITSDKFSRYQIPTPNSNPFWVALDQNHDVWFTEEVGNKIGELFPNGSMVEFPVPQGGYPAPSGITVDSTGKVWFTMPGTDSIGSFYRDNFTIDNLTGIIESPVGIAVDSHGNVWFTQHGPSFISEINPSDGYLRTISTSNNSLIESLPYFLWINSQNNVWFNEHQGNAMSEFQPSTNTLLEYFIPSGVPGAGNISYALTSSLSATGQPWYTELLTGKVGTVNISKPLDVNLNVQNYSLSSASIPNGSEISLDLAVSSEGQYVTLNAYCGNFTTEGNFTFTYSPDTGNNDFNSVVTIRNTGSLPGVYFVTLTARTNSLAVSKIVEIKVA